MVTVSNESSTQKLAALLAQECRAGDCILLNGDLGSGKTTFARGFIQSLQETPEEVVSPTFTLAQSYTAKDGHTLWHFDLYRLESEEELKEIGLDEALISGITLIEWPALAKHMLPESGLYVTIALDDHPAQRKILFSGAKDIWQSRLDKIKDARL